MREFISIPTWPALQPWKPLWSIMLLLCACTLYGCSATPSPATTAQQTPQATEVAHPFHTTVKTFDGEYTLTLDVTPNRSGTNVFILRVMDNNTHTLASHLNIVLYTTMQDMLMGTDSIILHADGNGQFCATSNNLSMSGHWAIGITIRQSDHVIHKAGVTLVIP